MHEEIKFPVLDRLSEMWGETEVVQYARWGEGQERYQLLLLPGRGEQ